MHSFEHSRGSLAFTFFGVRTVIRPSSWLMLLILGSGVGGAGMEVLPTLIFMAAGMLCLLVHEYGHAFCGRAMGSGSAAVEIASLGGVTVTDYPPRTRMGQLLTVLAGPGASLLLAALAGASMSLQLGAPLVKGVVYALTLPLPFDTLPELAEWCYLPVYRLIQAGGMSYPTLECYHTLFFVCVWWSIFNLLPILPMDGGKALMLTTNNVRLTAMVGLTVSILLGVWALTQLHIFTLLLSAWFIWLNLQYVRAARR